MAETVAPKIAEEELLRMTTDVVAAYVSNNTLPTAQLAEVINAVYSSLKSLEGQVAQVQPEPLKPAIPIRKSVTPEFLICLEDGKKLKMLKRHLRSTYNMTPDEYRSKWGLAPDYPMVAPNYAERRSEFAKKSDWGEALDGSPLGLRLNPIWASRSLTSRRIYHPSICRRRILAR